MFPFYSLYGSKRKKKTRKKRKFLQLNCAKNIYMKIFVLEEEIFIASFMHLLWLFIRQKIDITLCAYIKWPCNENWRLGCTNLLLSLLHYFCIFQQFRFWKIDCFVTQYRRLDSVSLTIFVQDGGVINIWGKLLSLQF